MIGTGDGRAGETVCESRCPCEMDLTQIKTINRRVGLPLFQMEEGMVVTSFLSDGVLGFQG